MSQSSLTLATIRVVRHRACQLRSKLRSKLRSSHSWTKRGSSIHILAAIFVYRSLDRDWKKFKVRGFLSPFVIRRNGGGRIPVNYRTIVRIPPRRPRCTRGNNKGLCSREERESFFIAISPNLHWRVGVSARRVSR